MNIDKPAQWKTERSQKKLEKIGLAIGIALFGASCCSYFIIDAFGEQGFALDCPKKAYHGLDSQGNEACRDILTNQIVEPKSVVMINSPSEVIDNSASEIIVESTPNTISSETVNLVSNNSEISITQIIIFGLFAVVGIVLGMIYKNAILKIFQRTGWGAAQKDLVQKRQYGKCNMCFTTPSKWKYDYFDANKNNNDIDNCQGLCPECFSKKSKRENRITLSQ